MIKNRLKKFLCEKESIYENGQLKVPAYFVIWFGFLFIMIVSVAGWFVYNFIKAPTQVLEILLFMIGVIGGLWLMAVIISIIIIPKTIIAYWKLVESKIELTCDKIVFPEEVKSIFAQIESLDEGKQQMFLKGIHPFLRKLGAE